MVRLLALTDDGKLMTRDGSPILSEEDTDHCCCGGTCDTCDPVIPHIITVTLSGFVACGGCNYGVSNVVIPLPDGEYDLVYQSSGPGVCTWHKDVAGFSATLWAADDCTTFETPISGTIRIAAWLIGTRWYLYITPMWPNNWSDRAPLYDPSGRILFDQEVTGNGGDGTVCDQPIMFGGETQTCGFYDEMWNLTRELRTGEANATIAW